MVFARHWEILCYFRFHRMLRKSPAACRTQSCCLALKLSNLASCTEGVDLWTLARCGAISNGDARSRSRMAISGVDNAASVCRTWTKCGIQSLRLDAILGGVPLVPLALGSPPADAVPAVFCCSSCFCAKRCACRLRVAANARSIVSFA
jgi:hypothetical protein